MKEKEDKDLLVKELCARQAYNVQVEYNGKVHSVLGISYGRLVLCEPFMSYAIDECPLVDEVKPYLFPLSSMTEEQRYEISYGLQNIHTEHPPFGKIENSGSDNCLECVTMASTWLIGYYNKNHFDYRGLIPKGLAIDCTNLNIY